MDEQPTAVFNPRVWWVVSCDGRNILKDTVGARRVKSASAKVLLVPDVSNRRFSWFGQTNAVAALVIAPKLQAHTSAVAYDHYSLLATIEDRLG